MQPKNATKVVDWTQKTGLLVRSLCTESTRRSRLDRTAPHRTAPHRTDLSLHSDPTHASQYMTIATYFRALFSSQQ